MGRRRKCQLVFQLPADYSGALDEDDVAEAVGNPLDDDALPHIVDGNAYGAGMVEFFIHTDYPDDAWRAAKPTFAAHGLLERLIVACRKIPSDASPDEDEPFRFLWPPGFEGPFSV